MTQHSSLGEDRWSRFDLGQQILMIGNEMNRIAASIDAGHVESLGRGYERVLRLTDLTVAGPLRPTFRRELLRWRDLAAELYLRDAAHAAAHRDAFRALLLLTPVAARQIELLPATRSTPPTA
ncbi:MAG: hypothetical protein FJ207_08020 [Gemmatimonadetes bacterium]|nr:hypothetical protein [Gemmatimonadota bacterium]